jgi:hypothetical protein
LIVYKNKAYSSKLIYLLYIIQNPELLYFEGSRLDIINSISSKAAISIKIGSKVDICCIFNSATYLQAIAIFLLVEFLLASLAMLSGFVDHNCCI